MTNHMPHDIQENQKIKQLLLQLSEGEDILEDLMLFGDRPEVLSVLVYKLAKEREQTNALLRELNAKYDAILEALNNNRKSSLPQVQLSEQDEHILDLIKQLGKVSAEDVKVQLQYKGLNAASQRLNRLVKEGILVKKRVGQKMYFMLP